MRSAEATHLLADFEAGRIDPAEFPHRQHVRVSYELLERYTFPETLFRLSKGLRRLAARAGRPEKYHETITATFLALVAERRLSAAFAGWEDFAARNPDLLRKELLTEFYDPAVLQSAAARQTFILPRLPVGQNKSQLYLRRVIRLLLVLDRDGLRARSGARSRRGIVVLGSPCAPMFLGFSRFRERP